MLEIVCDQLSHMETQKHYVKNWWDIRLSALNIETHPKVGLIIEPQTCLGHFSEFEGSGPHGFCVSELCCGVVQGWCSWPSSWLNAHGLGWIQDLEYISG